MEQRHVDSIFEKLHCANYFARVNSNPLIIHHKDTRMVKDEKTRTRITNCKLDKFRLNFWRYTNRDVATTTIIVYILFIINSLVFFFNIKLLYRCFLLFESNFDMAFSIYFTELISHHVDQFCSPEQRTSIEPNTPICKV